MPPAEDDNKDTMDVVEMTTRDAPEPSTVAEVGVGKYKTAVTSFQVPYLGQFFCSIILIIAFTAWTPFNQGLQLRNYAYGISLAAISMVFNLAGLFLVQKKEVADKQLFTVPMLGDFSVMRLLNYFLFIWWTIGAFILTFNGPFTSTQNGYFASWAGFAFAIMGIGIDSRLVQAAIVGGGSLLGLCVASLIMICATPAHLNGPFRDESLYGLILAVFTMAIWGAVLYMKSTGGLTIHVQRAMFVSLAIFAIMWFVMACLVTFRGPFVVTGNGYFGSWGGTFVCIAAAAAHMGDGDGDEETGEKEEAATGE